MNIKELRNQHRLTQKELAELIGVTVRTVERWEAGDRSPSPQVLELLQIKLSAFGGYVCKACGNPSPAGIGYASHGHTAWLASQSISECACGHSVKP